MAGHDDPGRRLQQLQFRVEVWRGLVTRQTRMPAKLWSEAVQLAGVLGEKEVRSALGIAARALQAGGGQRAPEATAAFVDLGAALAGAVPETMVEISEATGARLTLRLPVGATLDVARIVEAFRRGER